MGRNSQQRRADKKRRAARQQRLNGVAGPRSNDPSQHPPSQHPPSQHPPGHSSFDRRDPRRPHDPGRHHAEPGQHNDAAIERLVVSASQYASGTREHKAGFTRLMAQLVEIERNPSGTRRPSEIVAELLHRYVTAMYENGWQPADIAHAVKRECTVRAGRLVVAVIAAEARSTDAASRAPQLWLGQLEDLGVYDRARGAIIGGYDNAVSGWSRAERLDPDETLAISVQVVGRILMSPRQALLIDPPSAWGASNRGTTPKPAAAAGDVDAKALKLIRGLLAKAEATSFEAEAEAFTAKAQEMMTRYSIDAAVLASAARNAATGHSGGECGVEARRVHIDSPYADEKARFLSILAGVNGVRSVWSPHVGFATVTGFEIDLHLTDLLFTSLLVQATAACADATAADRTLRTVPFRRAFLVSFASRIGERLETTKEHASAAAEQQYGSALVPILADREAAVKDAFDRIFPETRKMSTRRLDYRGWHAGRAAADRAQIGAGQAIAAT